MRIQKKERIRRGRIFAVRTAAFAGAAFLFAWCNPIVSHAEATGTVIPKSVNIRKQPDQGSEVIGSSAAGKEISIRGQVDASGITWYQVYIDSNTMGYVRADMIEEKGDGDIPTVSLASAGSEDGGEETKDESQEDSSSEASSGGSGAQVEAQEEMDRQYAKTIVQSKVRPDPSTSNNAVDSLKTDSQVVVSGKSEGSDGRTWYFVTFTGSNGSEKTGYIRSDLLEMGDMLPQEEAPQEEAPEEEPSEPEEAPGNDYELKIETGSDGEEDWYIYDNVTGQKQKLVPLLEASYSQLLENDEEGTKSIVRQRIVIVVLAVLAVLLIIAVVIMAFKLRDAYYEDYEDDEEDEEEEDEEERRPARRVTAEREKPVKRIEAQDEESRPRRRAQEEVSRAAAGADRSRERRRAEREVTYQEEPAVEENIRPARNRKAKNFLLDDDEFEFEFLNMDDKDLK